MESLGVAVTAQRQLAIRVTASATAVANGAHFRRKCMTSSASGFSGFCIRTVNAKRGADSAPTSLRAGGLKQQGFAHLHGGWND